MTITVAPTEDQVFGALGQFIQAVAPGLAVVRGQANRVPPPAAGDYAVMWSRDRIRLGTNVDEFVDCRFTGDISGTTLTVSAVNYGTLKVGSQIFGVDLAASTKVISFGSGTGGAGTYQISPSQTITSRVMAAGVENVLQPTRFMAQIDVHGPLSGDNAQRISTLFRDGWGVDFFSAVEVGGIALEGMISPLYADDPKQIPFVDAQEQWEDRYVVEACLQIQATVLDLPQQFFEQVHVGLVNVDTKYPA